MITTIIKTEKGYYIPEIKGINENLKEIKVDIKILDEKDLVADAVAEHFENKRKREIKLLIDEKILKEFIKKNRLYEDENDFWESLK